MAPLAAGPLDQGPVHQDQGRHGFDDGDRPGNDAGVVTAAGLEGGFFTREVGGLLGNQVGGGSGKKIATVAGAAAGGYAGNKVQGNMQDKDTYTTTEQRCNTVIDTSENVVGYNVTYMIGDEEGTVRMDSEPPSRIPVENGQLVLD